MSQQLKFKANAIILQNTTGGQQILVQYDDEGSIYRFPGGTVELGETAAAALTREITTEEYAVDIKVRDLWIVNENFFNWQGTDLHEVNLFFRCELLTPSLQTPVPHREHVGIALDWRPIEFFKHVSLYPLGIFSVISSRQTGIHHLVSQSSLQH